MEELSVSTDGIYGKIVSSSGRDERFFRIDGQPLGDFSNSCEWKNVSFWPTKEELTPSECAHILETNPSIGGQFGEFRKYLNFEVLDQSGDKILFCVSELDPSTMPSDLGSRRFIELAGCYPKAHVGLFNGRDGYTTLLEQSPAIDKISCRGCFDPSGPA
jgi:hypothetical protein